MDGSALARVFAATAERRRAVADLLEALDESQLAAPSLCAGWDVLTVGAHLAQTAAPGALGEFLRDVVRARGSIHRANDAAARRAGQRPVAETVTLLRRRAESRFSPPLTGPRAPLTDLLVHEGDMRLPLGLGHDPDPGTVRVGLEFVTTGRAVGFAPRGRLRGLRLAATDLDWAWGEGAALTGRGIDLLMGACGRSAVLPRLDGAGLPLLAGRL
ncbi:maleylpyruvate isomerase family mycothiol-dependent enzyme [Isoptericola sp. NPDC058082]|uniref:maleylpyruvate isomerase family mycothiol-dependent enzyme n=1 Tax=Isoptericola sp. NPDC058082 TaxID=3346331 RepID=UPI0036EB16A3